VRPNSVGDFDSLGQVSGRALFHDADVVVLLIFTALMGLVLMPIIAHPPLACGAMDPKGADELIENALDHDPFSPNRQRSAPPAPAIVARELSAPEVLHLIGTVIDSNGGSFVLCQLGAGSARVLRVGQEVGVYQLHSISQGVAIFVTSDGQRLELRVSKGGS